MHFQFWRYIYKSQLELFIQRLLKDVMICMKMCSSSAKNFHQGNFIIVKRWDRSKKQHSLSLSIQPSYIFVAHKALAVGEFIIMFARIS